MDNTRMYAEAVADTCLLFEPWSSHDAGMVARLFDVIEEDSRDEAA
ncbi:MAG TPA: hypothetical protein VEO01_19605 [Pseudonocardiaceae bacterium]|nr:hypothetical protein [Pseudonocardiaceae bacterium]